MKYNTLYFSSGRYLSLAGPRCLRHVVKAADSDLPRGSY